MEVLEGRMLATRTPEKREANRTILLTIMLVIMVAVSLHLAWIAGGMLGGIILP